MFGHKPTRTMDSVLHDVTNRHHSLLNAGERFIAACDTFSTSGPPPASLGTSRRAFRPKQSSEQLAQVTAEAHRRLADVRSAMGLSSGDELDELPPSRNGHLLAHTDERLFIFDGSGHTYLLEASTRGLWLQAVDHANDMFTLVFRSGSNMAAVSTRRESAELTRAFIDSFPDRRNKARIVSTSTRDDTMGFPFSD